MKAEARLIKSNRTKMCSVTQHDYKTVFRNKCEVVVVFLVTEKKQESLCYFLPSGPQSSLITRFGVGNTNT